MKLDGKTAVITGASSGIGRATAMLFAAEGANVVACARRKERLEEAAREAEALPGAIVPCKADLTSEADINAVFDLAIDLYGQVDILVNCAGIMDNMVPAHEVSDDYWDKILNLNLTAVMRMTRRALKEMLQKERGAIVNIASIGGLMGCRAGAAYTASKFAVVGYTKNVGFMYATKGIRCNAICPGNISTEISEAGLDHPDAFGLERAMAGLATNPRAGTPDEIASVALFLASDSAAMVNATTVTADAGWTAY